MALLKKAAFATILAAFASSPVFADSIFTFTGTCGDCSGTVTATLDVTDTGSPLTNGTFVSLIYGGSNMFDPYTITASDPGLEVSGDIVSGTLPGPEDVHISNNLIFFDSFSDGFWQTGPQLTNVTLPLLPSDMGNVSSWAGNTSSAPEPTTIAMLSVALAGLVYFRRRLLRSES